MRIEVAYALPDRQSLVALDVDEGCTVFEAVVRSRIVDQFPEIDLANITLGLFGKRVEKPEEVLLRDGDRVEIYRPLLIDPKAVRRLRAEKKNIL